MHWRYRLRKQQLLDECDVAPEVFRGGVERLAEFARPFADCLVRREQRDHTRTYLAGLVSDLKHKNAESIAYLHDQERHACSSSSATRPGITGRCCASWPARSAARSAAPTACSSSTPRRSPRRETPRSACSGNGAVGSARSTTARSASSSPTSRTMSMPWSMSASTCPRSGPRTGPAASGAASPRRCATARGMSWPWRCWRSLVRCCRTAGSPATTRWAGRRGSGPNCAAERVLPAGGAVEHDGPRPGGRGARVERPGAAPETGVRAGPGLVRVSARGGVAADRGRRRRAGPAVRGAGRGAGGGADGPGADRAGGVAGGDPGPRRGRGDEARLLPVRRPAGDAAGVLARVAKAEHRVEHCLQRGKGEAGLAEYQVRTWSGWHHHQALSLIAAWFLARRRVGGKKATPALTVPQVRVGLASLLRSACGCDAEDRVARDRKRWLTRTALARFYRWKKCKRLAPLRKRLLL